MKQTKRRIKRENIKQTKMRMKVKVKEIINKKKIHLPSYKEHKYMNITPYNIHAYTHTT